MPVGTQAAVKCMSPREMEDLGFDVLLGNHFAVAGSTVAALVALAVLVTRTRITDGASRAPR